MTDYFAALDALVTPRMRAHEQQQRLEEVRKRALDKRRAVRDEHGKAADALMGKIEAKLRLAGRQLRGGLEAAWDVRAHDLIRKARANIDNAARLIDKMDGLTNQIRMFE